MPVMNVNLLLDEATYAGVKSGMLELCGMVKDTDSKKVRKHLPTVIDATKEGASKAIDIVREHKKGFLYLTELDEIEDEMREAFDFKKRDNRWR